MKKEADIREVARRARVSISTVSRAMNLVPSVRPALARRVKRVAEECHYFPSSCARSVASGESKLLGIVVPDIASPFFAKIVDSFETHAVQQGYEMLLANTFRDTDRTRAAVRRMIERRVTGIAVLTFGSEQQEFANFGSRHVPIVFLDCKTANNKAANIRINYLAGIRQAVQHLAALRHVKIGFIAGPIGDGPASARRTAFETCMRELELPVGRESVVAGGKAAESGRARFGDLMNSTEAPTAIICSDDLTAMEVLQEARRLQFSVPGDLSIVGIENIWFSAVTVPALTTVEVSQNEIARCAFSALSCAVQEHEAAWGCTYEVSTELIIRGSTALSARNPHIRPL